MHAQVAGTIAFNREDLPPKILEKLRRDLSFPNPEYITRIRLKRYVGDLEDRIECLKEDEFGQVTIPRGAVAILREICLQNDIPLSFDDYRVCFPRYGFNADVTLRAYQQEAVQSMCSGVQGIAIAPCGSGKSIIATSAITQIDQPTLIIVHTKDLLEQWQDHIRNIIKLEPGIIANGLFKTAPITIATVQFLVKTPRLYELSHQFGCVIVDECHHAPVATFQKVLSRLAAHYRFGLTATPYREDGMTRLIDWTFGNRLFEVNQQDLINERYLIKPEVRTLTIQFKFEAETYNHNDCMAALVADTERNDLIAELAETVAETRHTVLILSNRIEHCNRLVELIHNRGVETEALVGTMTKSERTRALNEFKSGRLPVVVATTLADEGMDITRLSRVILAYPSRAKARTIQRLGRLMRPHPTKTGAVLYDLVDEQVPQLKRQFQARRSFYRSLGIEPVSVGQHSALNSRPKPQDSRLQPPGLKHASH